jgi:hypothetical protein
MVVAGEAFVNCRWSCAGEAVFDFFLQDVYRRALQLATRLIGCTTPVGVLSCLLTWDAGGRRCCCMQQLWPRIHVNLSTWVCRWRSDGALLHPMCFFRGSD